MTSARELSSVLGRWLRQRWRVGSIAVYAATVLIGMVLFFFLHYLGNQVPYETVRLRFAEEFAVNQPLDERYFNGERPLFDWEFCQLSLAVMGGAHQGGGDRPLVDAVMLKSFQKELNQRGDYCTELRAVSEGAEFDERIEKPRYWWGSKALLAMALRYLSVFDLHRIILVASYGAWLALGAAVAMLGWRVLLMVTPTIVLGMYFSNISYWADVSNGIPYVWAVTAAAALALLLRWPTASQWAPWFCFVTGMVSSYLWSFDGHTALVIALIGLVAWQGYRRLNMSGEIGRAARCVGVYLVGFVICFALGQVVKAVVHEWSVGGNDYLGGLVAHDLFRQISYTWDQFTDETLAGETLAGTTGDESGWQKLPVVRDIRSFWLYTPLIRSADILLAVFSTLAFISVAVVAAWKARQNRPDLARSVSWLVALTLLVSVQFFLPDDLPLRTARFVFLLLAASWTCLAVALVELNHKASTIWAGCLVGIMLISTMSAYPIEVWRLNRTVASAQLIVRSDFDVYMDEDNSHLIYFKDECSVADVVPRFFLHIFPTHPADLPAHRRQYDFDNLSFDFRTRGERYGKLCAITIDLPDYAITRIRTGQWISRTGVQIWVEGAVFG